MVETALRRGWKGAPMGLRAGTGKELRRVCDGTSKELERGCEGGANGIAKGIRRGCEGVVQGSGVMNQWAQGLPAYGDGRSALSPAHCQAGRGGAWR